MTSTKTVHRCENILGEYEQKKIMEQNNEKYKSSTSLPRRKFEEYDIQRRNEAVRPKYSIAYRTCLETRQ